MMLKVFEKFQRNADSDFVLVAIRVRYVEEYTIKVYRKGREGGREGQEGMKGTRA